MRSKRLLNDPAGTIRVSLSAKLAFDAAHPKPPQPVHDDEGSVTIGRFDMLSGLAISFLRNRNDWRQGIESRAAQHWQPKTQES
jgi:hypothetical protein